MATEYCRVKGRTDSGNWIPFLKQLHIGSGVWAIYFMNGLNTGAPTVFVPQIRREWNSTATVDNELASWLYSASNFAALPWIFILPALSQFVGRKIPYLTCCIATSTVFALLYFSSSPHHILIAEAIQGFVNASCTCILIHVIPEYCNHRYRCMFLSIQCTTFYWGMWVSNAIGTFLSWKYITILGFICSLYSLTVSFYPESPRWLASKGKFTECEAAHRWLRGSKPEAEKELRDLIKSQADYPRDNSNMTCSRFMDVLTYKPFYMPLLLVILVSAQYNFSGKFVCSIYAIEILKKITESEKAAYTGMLVLDGVTVFGMYIGSFLSKILKQRLLFFGLSFLSIGVMFTFSLYLYLGKLGVIHENNIITLAFLVVYSLAISCGPITICLTIYSELISVRYQTISYMIASFFFLTLCTGMLKFAPVIFSKLELHGSFVLYGIACGVATILLFVYIPETKNKTLEEIEEYFKDGKQVPETVSLNKRVDGEFKV